VRLSPFGFGLPSNIELLDAPFGQRVLVERTGPGDVVLSTHLTARVSDRPVLVHWEVATDLRFRRPERYGLLFAHATEHYAVRVTVPGLEPGRPYWARFWAGGVWSDTVRLRTGVRMRRAA